MTDAARPMQYLYLDNFRGFSDTLLPLREVNFLVGENSTGKSSVLGVLHLLSLPQYWMGEEFGTDAQRFSHFRDIVSVHSGNRQYFSVGFAVEPQASGKEKSKSSPSAFLATYSEREGMPRLKNFTMWRDEMLHVMEFTASGVFFKSRSFTADSQVLDKKLFGAWQREHKQRGVGYKKLKTPGGGVSMGSLPLIFQLFLVESAATPEKSDKTVRGGSIRSPETIPEVVWLAPIRTVPRRTYDEATLKFSPEGEHTPYLIRKLLDSKSSAKDFLEAMKKFGDASGLFESVGIHRYGRSKTAPFEVEIVLDRAALNIGNVGYGVSQVLPVVVELLIRPKDTWFAVQQPEVHLHPKAQAALGDVLFNMAIEEKKRFFVETHSDFAIDRFRLNYQRRNRKRPDAQVLFFERRDRQNVVHCLPIDENGNLPSEQPRAYRDFFVREELRLLGI